MAIGLLAQVMTPIVMGKSSLNECKITRSWRIMAKLGITKTVGPDGKPSFSVSPCRAKPGHEGRYGCNHYRHASSIKAAKRDIALMTTQEEAMDGTINFGKDLQDLSDDLRQYLKSRGYKEEDLPDSSDQPIITSWFHNNPKEAEKFLNDAQEEGIIPKLKVSEELGGEIRNCMKNGIKVDVVADRMVGLKTDEDVERETDVWMTANKIPMKDYEGEAPITMVVCEGKSEAEAANAVRKTADPVKTIKGQGAMVIDPDDLESIGYVSMQGRHAPQK